MSFRNFHPAVYGPFGKYCLQKVSVASLNQRNLFVATYVLKEMNNVMPDC